MRLSTLAATALFSTLALNVLTFAQIAPATGHSFKVEGDHFALDGKPFRVLAGEMHYARVPRAYWRDRLRKAKAMGLNTITTYVFWNVHETQPGVYDFSGNNDVAEFVREAQEEGLYVNLRPGPYSCAEWDFGGYPGWLLKDHSMVVRSNDPKFIAAASRWIHRLGQELAPLQIGRGGPIIMVQIENEYGSFGGDRDYMNQIRHMIVDSGFTDAQLYTADGAEQMPKGSFADLPGAVNFGTGEAKQSFAALIKMRPDQPHMAGEYWDGWFDHWGGKHEARDSQQQIEEFRWIVDQGYSVSVYMFHGGTSFGFMSGSNSDGKDYQPDVTSYDYQATLDESGRPTAKYMAFRDIIAKATGVTPPPIPETPAPITLPAIQLQASRSLWDTLPAAISSAQPLTMEDIGQNFGYILYRTTLHSAGDGDLVLDQLHSYARIYLDGTFVGSLDRRLGKMSMPLHVAHADQRLDILVENSGRVNYSIVLRGERTGITKQVLWQGKPLEGWSIYPLPMTMEQSAFNQTGCHGPCFTEAHFTLAKTGDSFLDVRALGKGAVWINGHALGRFWDIGPQQTLYVPGVWLKEGDNEIVVFDLKGKSGATVSGLDHPLLDGPVEETAD
ncbi:MAG TPA: beta-galactosidase family protein [Terracidiphilus sp.]|nr:beta-galactosidase family protein [Terracidiphilus sp.]